jgi:hypothetical protein
VLRLLLLGTEVDEDVVPEFTLDRREVVGVPLLLLLVTGLMGDVLPDP